MKWRNAFYSFFWGLLFIVANFFSLFASTNGACQFPSKWFGEWFHSEAQPDERHISINETTFGSKGVCVENLGPDEYIIENGVLNCHQCILIFFNHENVLQYKEGLCSQLDSGVSLRSLCHDILSDNPLSSLYRVDAKPISCPFINPPFTFFYSRGEDPCSNPPSKIDACADDTKLLLHYSACADVRGSEYTTEELTCIAAWKTNSANYLITKVTEGNVFDPEKYKCNLYEPIMMGNTNTGYKIAQAESCNGLSSISDGSSIMTLTREDPVHTNCKYPSWITDQKFWRSLNSGVEYSFASSNATAMNMSDKDAMKMVCHSIEHNEEAKYTYVVVKVLSGCNVGYKCVLFHRRDAHIIEVQDSQVLSESYQDVCSRSKFDPSSVPLITYITQDFPPRKCPPLPNLTSLPQIKSCEDKPYHQVRIGCGLKPDKVELKPSSSCSNSSVVEFMCHGHWEAKQRNSTDVTGFIIASPLRYATNKYVCFSYTREKDIYKLRGTTPSCYEPSAVFSFQLKADGQCKGQSERLVDSGDEDLDESSGVTLKLTVFPVFVIFMLSIIR